MLGITVLSSGFDWRHPRGFRILRPHGTSDWGLMLVTTAAVMQDRPIPAGTALFFSPGHPQSYGSDGRPFANHWVHAMGPALAPLAAQLDIPIGIPMHLDNPTLVADGLQRIWHEQARRAPGWEVAASAALVATWVALARARIPEAGDGRLRDLRALIQARPADPWSAEGLARRAQLSPSRLRFRWQSAFGCSPSADVIAARISYAQRLLEGGLTVADAASRSGFNDLPYFHRQFRRLTGGTPGVHRRRGG